MRFEPKTKEELSTLWPKGEYDCEIIDACEHASKTGNEGIRLTARVFNAAGDTQEVYDYLMPTEKALFKTLQFCEATGLMAIYERGELTPDDCVGRGCKVQLKVEQREGYGDANKIGAYLAPKTAWQEQAAKQATVRQQAAPRQKPCTSVANPDEDDIPF